MATGRQVFIWAIRQVESGGNYKARNASGALGAYQVMPSNLSKWTKEATGRSMTALEFLNSKSAQDSVADVILGGYYDKYGAAGAASMWFSGQPDPTKNVSDGGNTVPEYWTKVQEAMASPDAGSIGSPGKGVVQAGVSDAIPGLKEVGNFFEFLTDPVTWFRFGMMVAGALLILIAMAKISGQAGQLKSVVDTATNVLPQTRAVKGVANGIKAAGK